MIKFGGSVPADLERRLERLVEVLAGDERVEALWLFGSRARGEGDALSDVDLAVLARRDADSRDLWDWQIEWTGRAVEALGTDEVAIQALNRVPVATRHGILRDARLLWARSPEAARDYEARTLKEYLDYEPLLDRYDRDLFRQAASRSLTKGRRVPSRRRRATRGGRSGDRSRRRAARRRRRRSTSRRRCRRSSRSRSPGWCRARRP